MVSIAAIPGLTYIVQRAPTLAGPWTNVATVTVGYSGVVTYPDTNAPAGKAFDHCLRQSSLTSV